MREEKLPSGPGLRKGRRPPQRWKFTPSRLTDRRTSKAARSVDLLRLGAHHVHVVADRGHHRLAVEPVPIGVGEHDVHAMRVRILEHRCTVVSPPAPCRRLFRRGGIQRRAGLVCR